MRMLIAICSVAIFGLAATGPEAKTKTLKPWGNAAGWQIMVDPTLGNGCLIRKIYPDGSEVRIGRDDNEKKGYVLVYDRRWGEIKIGETYPVTFDLDGKKYKTTARGMSMQGAPGGGIYFGDKEFFNAIAKKYNMSIFRENGDLVKRISLDGTYVALKNARKCERQLH